ncbi:hypothetical protein R1sor_006980 [Riccia sorocarpa]|uniref:ACB domain-containing protein n=1 Tax=Riccia sorocarpa TaxID=122646 RepID=A0ABD3HSM0_9MARC
MAGALALPYPDRFHAAAVYAGFGQSSPSTKKSPSVQFSDDTALLLYSLYQQATVGPCNIAKPWSWNVVEYAKWTSWNQLGKMAKPEAMRLFVRTLEEEEPDWYTKAQESASNEKDPEWWSNAHDEEVAKAAQLSSGPALVEAKVEPNVEEKQEKAFEQENTTAPIENLPVSSIRPTEMNGHESKTEESIKETRTEENKTEEETTPEDPVSPQGYDAWFSPVVNGRRPAARYQHAAAVVGDKMFVIGGNHNGRYLNDVQVLDLVTMTWSKLEQKTTTPLSPKQATFPPCAGHSLIQLDGKLFLVAGHSKEDSDIVTVRSFDTATLEWSVLQSYGQAPVARGGQTVTKVGNNLVMFGGEDAKRRLYNDLNILDLETMTWDAIETGGTPPSPRSDHAATVHDDRYLFIFGGGSHSTCFNDLHVLDLESVSIWRSAFVLVSSILSCLMLFVATNSSRSHSTFKMEWSRPQQQGSIPSARAGHAGVTIGDSWYIVGGGDNKTGISDTLVLNMATSVWHVVATEQGRTPIASEGLSVVSASLQGEESLISFGGYNGRYSNEVYMFKASPSMKTKQKVLQSPAAAAAAASAAAAFTAPRLEVNGTVSAETARMESQALSPKPQEPELPATSVQDIVQENNGEQLSVAKLQEELEAALTEAAKYKRDLASSLLEYSDLEQELVSVRGQLADEQSRCFRLEVDVAELRQKLQSIESLQKEVDLLRKQKAAAEEAALNAAAQKSGSGGGIFSWLAGGQPDSKSVPV